MLPTTRRGFDKGSSRPNLLVFFARRYAVFILVAFALLFLLARIWRAAPLAAAPLPLQPNENALLPAPLPPLYSAYHFDELRLPQHHWERKKPAPTESFFYVAGHARGTGWGNGMEEYLLNAYIAYKAGRSFVFSNYTWNADGSLYSDYNGKKIPSTIPYSAIVRGYFTGDPLPAGNHAPQAVSREYYQKLCPKPKVYIREDVHDHISSENNAKQITDGWVAKLKSTEDPCVQTALGSGQLFNYMVFGDKYAMHDIWDEFTSSPIVTHFRWSPLVELAYDNNRELFKSSDTVEPYYASLNTPTNRERYPEIPGLLALHVRRGDFEEHCIHIGNWSSDYVAVNNLPGMADQFIVPSHEGWGWNTPENHAIYRKHCYPSVDEIVQRVREVRRTPAGKGLRRAFIMTNGSPEYVMELKLALWHDGDWELITSSRDLVLNWEQKYIAQAVDMLVGQRAQVLIGNGFSTMTSNMVMMRMVNGFPVESTRFF
ncbi:uncharacterized protein BXZ73DRAFT_46087 [Epithele typhae]|uniref:uncharacterized protein n=1 Tax=Epithele typhae TaxID=378194 RepID=UPI002008DD2C|nr:uncharacterized protein BXZ73DRAFT_46087 [Epithele typhae]KAH9934094.1 hypothetical protein BXZ73DRAFT_46087 [Epithele typhae]